MPENINQPKLKDLASNYPEVEALWHPTKNVNGPSSVSPRSRQKCWWRCPLGHDFEEPVYRVVNARETVTKGCPFCEGPSQLFTSLSQSHPVVVDLWWHSAKNDSLNPDTVTEKSRFRAWWHCSSSHEWQESIASFLRRVNSDQSTCPLCPEASAVARAVVPAPNPNGRWRDEHGRWRTPRVKKPPPEVVKKYSYKNSREQLIAFARSRGGMFTVTEAAEAFVSSGEYSTKLRAANRVTALIKKYPTSFFAEGGGLWRCAD